MKKFKFKGKSWEMRGFIQYLVHKFGAKTTIKEVYEKIKENNNVSM